MSRGCNQSHHVNSLSVVLLALILILYLNKYMVTSRMKAVFDYVI